MKHSGTKKSGSTSNYAALQPDGLAPKATTIIPCRDPLVTLARISVGLGCLLMFILGGKLDHEMLTGVGISEGLFNVSLVTAINAVIAGLVALKTEGAFNAKE
mgnify:CR=1 FL=1